MTARPPPGCGKRSNASGSLANLCQHCSQDRPGNADEIALVTGAEAVPTYEIVHIFGSDEFVGVVFNMTVAGEHLSSESDVTTDVVAVVDIDCAEIVDLHVAFDSLDLLMQAGYTLVSPGEAMDGAEAEATPEA